MLDALTLVNTVYNFLHLIN